MEKNYLSPKAIEAINSAVKEIDNSNILVKDYQIILIMRDYPFSASMEDKSNIFRVEYKNSKTGKLVSGTLGAFSFEEAYKSANLGYCKIEWHPWYNTKTRKLFVISFSDHDRSETIELDIKVAAFQDCVSDYQLGTLEEVIEWKRELLRKTQQELVELSEIERHII